MGEYSKKKKELLEKYKDCPCTYEWYTENKCELFSDISLLQELYEQTDEYKQKLEESLQEYFNGLIDIKDADFVLKFINGKGIYKVQ